MTLTVDLAELRTANEKALAALSRTSKERFDTELAEIENFLLSLYRFAVLAVRNEQEIERAAEVWRETLDVFVRESSSLYWRWHQPSDRWAVQTMLLLI